MWQEPLHWCRNCFAEHVGCEIFENTHTSITLKHADVIDFSQKAYLDLGVREWLRDKVIFISSVNIVRCTEMRTANYHILFELSTQPVLKKSSSKIIIAKAIVTFGYFSLKRLLINNVPVMVVKLWGCETGVVLYF